RPGCRGGGAQRPFGYADDKVTVVAAEAEVIRAAVGRIVAGETLRSVTVWLNESRVATVTGKQWSPQTVRGILTNPRYAGVWAAADSGRGDRTAGDRFGGRARRRGRLCDGVRPGAPSR